ncbi:MAG: bacterial regulatory s, tetR family protein [Micavibrio sp.]|nr:bacterial regulatory s, tetR family protein [Micavibrio sp.]
MAQALKLELVQSESHQSASPVSIELKPAPQAKNKTAGRPRSEASRTAILDATRRLMTHTSVRDLSIEAIAKKAEVGKTTIYRWWSNKVAVVIEAHAEQLDMHMLTAGNESPRDNLVRQVERLVRQLRGKNGRIIADLLAEAQSDTKVLEQFNQFYMDSRRNALRQTIIQGQKNGDFSETFNSDMAVDMVLGPIVLRLMSGEDAIDEGFASHYPSMAVDALRA